MGYYEPCILLRSDFVVFDLSARPVVGFLAPGPGFAESPALREVHGGLCARLDVRASQRSSAQCTQRGDDAVAVER